jgi:hypothetical protein
MHTRKLWRPRSVMGTLPHALAKSSRPHLNVSESGGPKEREQAQPTVYLLTTRGPNNPPRRVYKLGCDAESPTLDTLHHDRLKERLAHTIDLASFG